VPVSSCLSCSIRHRLLRLNRQKAESRRQKAESRRQKAESRRRKAEGRGRFSIFQLPSVIFLSRNRGAVVVWRVRK
jgi:hypothetical protein